MNLNDSKKRWHGGYIFRTVGRPVIMLLVTCLAVLGSQQQNVTAEVEPDEEIAYEATWESLDSRQTPSWFQD